jgi:hypothetical protein
MIAKTCYICLWVRMSAIPRNLFGVFCSFFLIRQDSSFVFVIFRMFSLYDSFEFAVIFPIKDHIINVNLSTASCFTGRYSSMRLEVLLLIRLMASSQQLQMPGLK